MPARIFSMSFNMMATLLCVSSGTETVHVFRLSTEADGGNDALRSSKRSRRDSTRSLGPPSDGDDDFKEDGSSDERFQGHSAESDSRAHDGTFVGMFRRTSQTVTKSLAARMGGYLPSAVSEMLEPARDFAWFKLPRLSPASSSMKSVVALSSNSPQVMVVTSEGTLLVYNIDLEKGGEGTLTKQYS